MMSTILGMNLRYQPTKLRNLLEHCLKVMEMLLLGSGKYSVIYVENVIFEGREENIAF